MTVRYFTDINQTSQNGEYHFTAVTPDENFFQRNFTYSLHKNNELLWQRTQPQKEDSPTQLFVSNQGRCLALTSGLCSDTFLCFSETGEVLNDITVTANPEHEDNLDIVHALTGRVSTAGLIWGLGTYPLFFQHQEEIYFAMSTTWLKPIIIETGIGELIEQLTPDQQESLKAAQAEHITKYLSKASSAGNKWLHRFRKIDGALLLLPQVDFPDKEHRLNTLAKLPDQTYHHMNCYSLENGWQVHTQYLAPLLTAAMMLSDLDYTRIAPTYHFVKDEMRYAFPATTPPKDLPMTSAELLNQHGPPHYLKPYSEKKDDGRYHWGEHWEYYLSKNEALRITWAPGTEGKQIRSHKIIELKLLERMAEFCIG